MKSKIKNNKFYSSITLICISLFVSGIVFQGCQQDSFLSQEDDYITVNNKLQNDADLLYLMEIKDEITNRLINSKIPLEDIKAAFLAGDENFINKALCYSENEMSKISNLILRSGNNLMNRYPLIEKQVTKRMETECLDCVSTDNINFLFANLEKTASPVGNVRLRSGGESSSVDWVGYTLCIAACSLTAPTGVGYIACCALCVYTFGGF